MVYTITFPCTYFDLYLAHNVLFVRFEIIPTVHTASITLLVQNKAGRKQLSFTMWPNQYHSWFYSIILPNLEMLKKNLLMT